MPFEDGGTGLSGEGIFGTNDESTGFFATPVPDAGWPANPRPQDRPQAVPYGSSSGLGSNSTSLGGTYRQVQIGTDPFGNPIYSYVLQTPMRESYDLNPGWNSRGYIPEPIGASMYLSFEAGTVVGAVVGLTENQGASAGYADIILGWMILDGVAHIVSRGQVLLTLDVATTLPDPGKYNRDVDHLTMIKKRDKVEFLLTSATGQSGQTLIAEATMTEDVTYVSAALYLGGDRITSEVLEYPEFVDGDLPAMQGGIYEEADAFYVMGEFPAMTGEVYDVDSNVIGGSFPAFTGLVADEDVNLMQGEIPALTGEVESYSDTGSAPEFNYTFSALPALNGGMMVYDEEFETLTVTTPALGGFISEEADATIVRGILPKLRGFILEDEFPDRLTLISFGYLAGRAVLRPTVVVVLNSSAQVIGVLDLDEIHSMLLESEVSITDTATLTEIIYQALMSTMSAADVASLQRDGMSVWALHMDSMGSTRYEGYDFNSFMTIDGHTYGVNATGIHRLEGSTDDGARIPASVDFGSLSFGTNNRKALPYVYVGMASSGRTVLKIESDGQTYYYTARDSTELMKAHRFEPGRGLRSTFYSISLETDGEAFDLHNIDFQPVELKRSL